MNELVRGPYSQLLNCFHANLKLERTERKDGRIKSVLRKSADALGASAGDVEVCGKTKERLRQQKRKLNPFALKAEVERRLKEIESLRSKN